MLTDKYQLTMCYAYWFNGLHERPASFDLTFRRNPFGGGYTIFEGVEEAMRFTSSFRFTDHDIAYLREGYNMSADERQHSFRQALEQGFIRQSTAGFERVAWGPHDTMYWEPTEFPTEDIHFPGPLQGCKPKFFDWLATVDCSDMRIYAMKEGSVVFPNMPLYRLDGPLGVGQLMETTLLNLTNFPSLVATLASRLRHLAGDAVNLLEFGLRRAQGPDGAMSASRYAYAGGFDATSNILAAQYHGVPDKGTHAHAFVSSFRSLKDLKDRILTGTDGQEYDFVSMVLQVRQELGYTRTNEGELAAFITYARSFPNGFLALVDTYNTLESGVPNFLCVAIALYRLGYRAIGIRLDSGKLAELSKAVRGMFKTIGQKYGIDFFADMTIVASNDIDEDSLEKMNAEGHEIDAMGIGTRVATCWPQPALGCVYKLVWIDGSPRIKLSDSIGKTIIPGRKRPCRLIDHEGYFVADMLFGDDESIFPGGETVVLRNPFDPKDILTVKRTEVVPFPLHELAWDGELKFRPSPIDETKAHTKLQLGMLRDEYLKPEGGPPYRVALSESMFDMMHSLWKEEGFYPW